MTRDLRLSALLRYMDHIATCAGCRSDLLNLGQANDCRHGNHLRAQGEDSDVHAFERALVAARDAARETA